jgi:hypothetical protein
MVLRASRLALAVTLSTGPMIWTQSLIPPVHSVTDVLPLDRPSGGARTLGQRVSGTARLAEAVSKQTATGKTLSMLNIDGTKAAKATLQTLQFVKYYHIVVMLFTKSIKGPVNIGSHSLWRQQHHTSGRPRVVVSSSNALGPGLASILVAREMHPSGDHLPSPPR